MGSKHSIEKKHIDYFSLFCFIIFAHRLFLVFVLGLLSSAQEALGLLPAILSQPGWCSLQESKDARDYPKHPAIEGHCGDQVWSHIRQVAYLSSPVCFKVKNGKFVFMFKKGSSWLKGKVIVVLYGPCKLGHGSVKWPHTWRQRESLHFFKLKIHFSFLKICLFLVYNRNSSIVSLI